MKIFTKACFSIIAAGIIMVYAIEIWTFASEAAEKCYFGSK